jgi:hypothetical protein
MGNGERASNLAAEVRSAKRFIKTSLDRMMLTDSHR